MYACGFVYIHILNFVYSYFVLSHYNKNIYLEREPYLEMIFNILYVFDLQTYILPFFLLLWQKAVSQRIQPLSNKIKKLFTRISTKQIFHAESYLSIQ